MIRFVSETGSTNADLLAQLRSDHIPEGDWLVADRQVSGRGRQGRDWLDGIGNFMGSTVVHLRKGDPPAATLALVAGLAVHEVVAPLLPAGRRATLKWPNDVMVDQAKLAGILLERIGESVVIGIGVNLVVAPRFPERETISLSDLAPTPERNTFASCLAGQFAIELDRWRGFGLEPILRRWTAAAHPVGTPICIGGRAGDVLSGVFAGLADDGALQLRLPDGTTHTIHSGEVSFARIAS